MKSQIPVRMKMRNSRLFRFGIALLGFVTVAMVLWSQGQGLVHNRIPLAEDWSHRHVIFSSPTTAQQAYQITQQYRYWNQWFRRNARVQISGSDTAFSRFAQHQSGGDVTAFSEVPRRNNQDGSDLSRFGIFRLRQHPNLQRDWATSLTANATAGDGMYPAKFTFDINAAPSCTNDFVVFTTSLSAGATTVDIIAYNQLYSGSGGICSGPSVLWAYQTTSQAGKTVTSPVLSLDGTQVVYVEGTGGTAALHILRPGTGAQGTLGAPVTPTPSANAAAYVTCKATPGAVCLLNIPFGNAADDSFSPPFYDFGGDVLYVGDNGGSLHKFTGIFKGTPAEVTTAPWPFTINSTHALTGPVKDDTSGNVFVNDVDGTLWYVRESASLVGACSSGSPPCLGSTNIPASVGNSLPPPRQAITDPPIVDSTTGRVFVFTGHGSNFPSKGANVWQANTALTAASAIDLDVGQGDSFTLHTGAFDNAYFTNVATGHLYVCANSGALAGSGSGFDADNQPTLRRISFNSNGTMNSVDTSGTLQLTTPPGQTGCSPVTEILNGTTDWMFMSVKAIGSPAACGGNGCVVSVSVPTALPFTFPAAVSAALAESGGTSGIVVDNVSTAGQASSIYFTILANSTVALTCGGTTGVGCAVKATQSGLN